MSSRVAPLIAISEQATSPSVASSSSGSSRSRHSRGRAGGGSEAGWIGVAVLTRRAKRSGLALRHRVALAPTWNSRSLTSNHFDRIRRAAGAAVSAPKPPFSTVDDDDDRLAGSAT